MDAKMLAKIEAVFESHPEVKLAYFFGSRNRGNSGAMSDFDFAFYADNLDAKQMFELKLTLIAELGRVLATDKVDVVCLNLTESPELKYAIIREGRLILEKEPYKVIVEPKIMNEYFDFYNLLKRYNLTKA
jgi:hypothetical protein